MKTWAVRIEGTGIGLPLADDDGVAIGFFTTRWVKAVSVADAQRLAKAAVLAQWQAGGRFAASNAGAVPLLVVETVWDVGLFRAAFGRRPGGYTFYAAA